MNSRISMTRYTILLLTISLISSCKETSKFDEEKARQEILELHNAQRAYHFEKDSTAFVNQLSHDFISVNRGEITTPSKNETKSRYYGYFNAVDFNKWDDLSEPIIRFSCDGTLAYTIVDKIVEVTYKDSDATVSSTHFAWMAVYRKTLDGWKIESVASTNVPADE